ncbi:MAG: fructosamine kinase family protein [Methylococcaceae bacterium]|nr:fructosamine kinase family protein [Methylococcaceae bacterium]MDZ4157423.1 fructosamine kinase family protein [Methylococcales bacterium]MDP2393662.1 fructosamine kinase family protein [Methylococcaceae bacterium]MDP3020702.1 fructosamine kinase family protein [Methylococcaceae bacterium]MDP3390449.1 fructosamine kinase family protein [Methylococcaceae bacterium]
MIDWASITNHIAEANGSPCAFKAAQSIAGGDINSAYILKAEDKTYFVKLNRASLLAMFEAECAGLIELALANAVKVPKPVVFGVAAQQAFLVLDYIPLKSKTAQADILLGQQLAMLHQQIKPYFGWQQDNTIGSTAQLNRAKHHWVDFWREQRLGFQLQLAAQNGFGGRLQTQGQQLQADLEVFFNGFQPQPCLLHGDLWGGNAAADAAGQPVIFDPACYYGDRETDIAMTELFGGFGADFYVAYNESYALDVGFKVRKNLYNLYHILNHLNLFGGGYLGQAERSISLLLAEV